MKIFSIKYKTTIYTYVKDDEEIFIQSLKKCICVLGVCIVCNVYHSERIPTWAYYQNAILGSSDWVSTNSEIIDRHNEMQKTLKNKLQ